MEAMSWSQIKVQLALCDQYEHSVSSETTLMPTEGAAGQEPHLQECLCSAGTPFWKLVLKQFDDLLVKVTLCATACCQQGSVAPCNLRSLLQSKSTAIWMTCSSQMRHCPGCTVQILLVAAVVDFVIALVSGEEGLR